MNFVSSYSPLFMCMQFKIEYSPVNEYNRNYCLKLEKGSRKTSIGVTMEM